MVMSVSGHNLRMTLPRTSANGTGPYSLESVELVALSPSSQICPRGTTVYEQPDQTQSPATPVTRLQMYNSGAVIDLDITISPFTKPRLLFDRCSQSTTLSVNSVGSMDGPQQTIRSATCSSVQCAIHTACNNLPQSFLHCFNSNAISAQESQLMFAALSYKQS